MKSIIHNNIRKMISVRTNNDAFQNILEMIFVLRLCKLFLCLCHVGIYYYYSKIILVPNQLY